MKFTWQVPHCIRKSSVDRWKSRVYKLADQTWIRRPTVAYLGTPDKSFFRWFSPLSDSSSAKYLYPANLDPVWLWMFCCGTVDSIVWRRQGCIVWRVGEVWKKSYNGGGFYTVFYFSCTTCRLSSNQSQSSVGISAQLTQRESTRSLGKCCSRRERFSAFDWDFELTDPCGRSRTCRESAAGNVIICQ